MTKEYLLTSESTLTQAYVRDITPFWDNVVTKRTIQGQGDISLYVTSAIAPDSKGTVVLSSGRTEGAIKYKELFYNLYQNGFSVFSVDHRGQGQSQRLVANPDKGHVEDYQDYVDDFHLFYSSIVAPESPHKPVLLCHSMGCVIGAKYNLMFPEHFDKVVYCSPMFAIKAPIPVWLAKTLIKIDLKINKLFSEQPWYFLGQGNYQAEVFSGNEVTHSEIRFQLSNHDLDSVSAQLGGVTNQWLLASLKAMKEIEQQAGQLQQPSLLLQAGADSVVENSMQKLISRRMPDCQLLTIENAKHELLHEKDQYRNLAMEAILTFFQPKE